MSGQFGASLGVDNILPHLNFILFQFLVCSPSHKMPLNYQQKIAVATCAVVSCAVASCAVMSYTPILHLTLQFSGKKFNFNGQISEMNTQYI